MDKRGEYQDFPPKTFCPTVPKISVGEPFCVSQKFWYRKNLWIRGGEEGEEGEEGENITIFCPEIFCPTVPKISVGEPFCVSQNFWYRKNLWIRGGGRRKRRERRERREGVSRFSVQKFFSHCVDKFRRGTLLCCVSENFR